MCTSAGGVLSTVIIVRGWAHCIVISTVPAMLEVLSEHLFSGNLMVVRVALISLRMRRDLE